jgi:CubicO group peptidase (beta-lactamase class C family)
MLLDTPSRLASVTKPFTALAILTLVEDGVINVNASVIADRCLNHSATPA